MAQCHLPGVVSPHCPHCHMVTSTCPAVCGNGQPQACWTRSLCTTLLSPKSEGAAPHETLDSCQARDFFLAYSKANHMRTHLRTLSMVPVRPFSY